MQSCVGSKLRCCCSARSKWSFLDRPASSCRRALRGRPAAPLRRVAHSHSPLFSSLLVLRANAHDAAGTHCRSPARSTCSPKHAPCQAVGSDMTSRTPSCKHDGQSSAVHKMARCKVDSVDSWRGNGNGPSNYRRASPAACTSAQPCSCVPGHTPVSPDGTCCQSSCPCAGHHALPWPRRLLVVRHRGEGPPGRQHIAKLNRVAHAC